MYSLSYLSRTRGVFFACLSVLPLCGQALSAADYYVATNGDDTNTGTLLEPFASIMHAKSIIQPGDTVHIYGGTYHEELALGNLSGADGSPITFQAYDDQEVTVSGAEPVTTSWQPWDQNPNVWVTTLDPSIADPWQLFVDGKAMTEARWPNVTSDYMDPDEGNGDNPTQGSFWDRVTDQRPTLKPAEGSTWGHMIASDARFDLAGTGLDFTGGMMHTWETKWSGDDRAAEIQNHSVNSNEFDFDPSLHSENTGEDIGTAGMFWISSHINCLDVEREWYYDMATRKLYLYFEAGKSPSNSYVEAKVRLTTLTTNGASYLNFNGITFLGGAFSLDSSSYMTFDDCRFLYPTYRKHMLKEDIQGVSHSKTDNGGGNFIWRNCEFAYHRGSALYIRTWQPQLIDNCYFHNGQWGPTTYGAVSDKKGQNTTVSRCTFHTLGKQNSTKNGGNGLIEYNHSYNFYFHADASAHQIPTGAQPTTTVRYNWAHDLFSRNGIRFDGDPAGMNCTLYRCVSFRNTRGFRLKGDQHKIYHITGFDNNPKNDINIAHHKFYGYQNPETEEVSNDPTLGWPKADGRRGNMALYGNENSILKSVAGQNCDGLEVPNMGPYGDASHNLSFNTMGLKIKDHMRDPDNYDFRPREGSALIDAGTVVAEVSDTFNGSAPDAGAYEYGDDYYWIPGCRFKNASTPVPPNNGEYVKSNADLMWLEGRDWDSHNVFFGTDQSAVENATVASTEYLGNYTNNIATPGSLVEGVTYYWRVDVVKTGSADVKGDIWSFTQGTKPIPTEDLITPAVEDSYTDTTSSNYGSGTLLSLDNGKQGWMKFDLDYRNDTEVLSGSLIVTLSDDPLELPESLSVYMAEDSWGELTISGTFKPAVGSLVASAEGPFVAGQEVSFDIASEIGDPGAYSFVLKDTSTAASAVKSKESGAAARLELVIVQPANSSPFFDGNTFNKPDAVAGIPYSGSLIDVVTEPDGDTVTFQKIDGADWLDISPDGTLSGTPLAEDIGKDPIYRVRVIDELGASNDSLMTIGVLANTAPSFVSDPVIEIDAGEGGYYVATLADDGSDPDGEAVTYARVDGPDWLDVAADGALTGKPLADDNGLNSFTVSITDNFGNVTESELQVTVVNTNVAPEGDDQTVMLDEDSSASVTITGFDYNGDSITLAVSAQPQNGTLTGSAPDFVYIPNADFAGEDSFSFIANDGVYDSAPATVTLSVEQINDAPVAIAQNVSFAEDTDASITLTGADIDGDSLSYNLQVLPEKGTLTGVAPDLIYTPEPDFHGSDSFTFSVNDGTVNSTVAVVGVVVTSVNDAPVFSAASIDGGTVGDGEEYSGLISSYASDAENDTLTFSKKDGPEWLVVSAEGSLSGSPYIGDVGLNSFTITASDGALTTDVTYTVTVNQVTNGTWIELSYDDFESGWGSWLGNDSENSQISSNAVYASSGVNTLRIADNPTTANAALAVPIDLSDPDIIALKVEYNAVSGGGLKSGHGYNIQFYDNTTWSTIESFSVPNTLTDGVMAANTVCLYPDAHAFTSGVNLKFKSTTNRAWRFIHLDDIRVSIFQKINMPPQFESSPIVEVDADEDSLYSVSLADDVTDAEGEAITFIMNGTSDWLDLNQDGTLSGTPANHDVGVHVISVEATDSYGNTTAGTVEVTVINVNDDPTVGDTAGSVVENGSAGAAVATVVASDPDVGDSLSYAITAGNSGGFFAIDSNGNVTATGALDYESASQHVLTVEVSDGSLTDTATVTVDVTDVNEAPVANNAAGNVYEDASVGIIVASVSASDVDSGASLSYAITAGNTGNAFNIDSNGNVKTASALDYETTDSYILTVEVSDGSLSDTAIVSITVDDVLEVTTPVIVTGAASNLSQTEADIAYSVTDEGGEAPTVTVYYGETDGGQSPVAWGSSVAVSTQAVGNYVENLTGLTEGTEYFFTVHATNSGGTVWGSSSSFTTEADTSPKLVRTTVSSVGSSSWTSVDLGQSYDSAVIIATPIYPNSSIAPVVTRIRNVSGSSFELKLDRADGLTDVVNVDVSIVAVEEGVYTQATDGVTMEAVKYTSTVTSRKSNWTAEARTFQNSYITPVVVGQVMSTNDANWSTFWSIGSSRTNPVDANNLNVGKHVAEDTNTTRADETIGYIVIESGSGTINGVAYEAALGADLAEGVSETTTGWTYNLSGGLTSASAVALSQSGVDGDDGGWAVLYGVTPFTSTSITLAIDEDQIANSERNHVDEQACYIIFE